MRRVLLAVSFAVVLAVGAACSEETTEGVVEEEVLVEDAPVEEDALVEDAPVEEDALVGDDAAPGEEVVEDPGGVGTGDPEATHEALTRELTDDTVGQLTGEQADCVAGEIISRIGADRVAATLEATAGGDVMVDEVLTDEEFRAVMESYEPCDVDPGGN